MSGPSDIPSPMSARSMTLADLVAGSNGVVGLGDAAQISVSGLQLDSRKVQPGDAFVALRGTRQHGIAFAARAQQNGAVAILAETPVGSNDATLPVIAIDALGQQLGDIAARWQGNPTASMNVVGITGTNGKTSTVQLLAQALSLNGRNVASIGTLGAGRYGAIAAGERTTPDAIELQGLFADFRDEAVSDVAMEVSSHALAQGRVNAVEFDVAVFTNLSRDHLDYHGDMDSYATAKARLFQWPSIATAIINIDDVFGRQLLGQLPDRVTALSYGIDNAAADIVASNVRSDGAGVHFHLRSPWGSAGVDSCLLGRFNVANLLAVVACLAQSGVAFDDIIATLPRLEPVAGRMNRIDAGDLVLVIDYAHTPDALEQALTSLRAHCAGKLICVFGCGGDRDQGKRPQMAEVAERLADAVIVTDDNPRGESGDEIVAQIVAGFVDPERAMVERDRERAIHLAAMAARGGDIVLIAGKGHETYQEIGEQRLPFDDRIVARAAAEANA
ncbi:MAG: UDP-N-acetylmuramoyl-L-alanyl-D-glutamate--2,6-diaminopimelate ligase [Dokdonella sp.]